MDILSLELECISFKLSIAFREFSTIFETLTSISLEFAPGYRVKTEIAGNSTSGYKSTGNLVNEYIPNTMIATKTIIVVIGFFTALL